MIYAIGVDHDKTFVHFLSTSLKMEVAVTPINLRAVIENEWEYHLTFSDTPNVIGESYIQTEDGEIQLEPNSSYYCRIIDLSTIAKSKESANRWRWLCWSLSCWLETIPGVVINRQGTQHHNGAKPLHEAVLSRLGLRVPESFTSSCPDRLRAFASGAATIVKAVSGVRADCRLVMASDFELMDRRAGPVHLQRFVVGDDVRAHVIGNVVVSELITSPSVDYRKSPGGEYRKYELPAELQVTLVAASRLLGLTFAGWDFKVDRNGIFWCLEVNPMPGYDSYDRRLGGEITRNLLRVLSQ